MTPAVRATSPVVVRLPKLLVAIDNPGRSMTFIQAIVRERSGLVQSKDMAHECGLTIHNSSALQDLSDEIAVLSKLIFRMVGRG